MTYPCDPCSCPEAYYRDLQSFRKAVLELFCIIASKLTEPKNLYLQEGGSFFYLKEDGSGLYEQE